MWITVVPGSTEGPELLLPERLFPGTEPTRILLRYGAASATVTATSRAHPAHLGLTASSPVPVSVSPLVLERLHIRTEPVYQVKAAPGEVEIGPVLGLLLGSRTNWYDDAYLQREPERVTAVYPVTGGLFCAFSPRNYSDEEGCAYGLFFNPGNSRWEYGALPPPAVLHRRSFFTSPSLVARAAGEASLFNSRRFTKWELYQIIAKDPELKRCLPATVEVRNGPEVFSLLRSHPTVVLKPSHLSRGRGILFVTRDVRRFRVLDCRGPGPSRHRVLTKDEMQALIQMELTGGQYLAQQRIALAEIDGAPFDIRVVAQRGPGGDWSEHAIECRLAGPGNLVTNIAYGGMAMTLPVAVRRAFGRELNAAEVEAQALALAAKFCRLLDTTGEHFAEWGIDLALDRGGRLWFLEANVIPTYKGFADLDPAVYRRLLAAPMRYAAALAGFEGK